MATTFGLNLQSCSTHKLEKKKKKKMKMMMMMMMDDEENQPPLLPGPLSVQYIKTM